MSSVKIDYQLGIVTVDGAGSSKYARSLAQKQLKADDLPLWNECQLTFVEYENGFYKFACGYVMGNRIWHLPLRKKEGKDEAA